MKLKRHILAVDDNRGVLTALELLLTRRFERVSIMSSPDNILQFIGRDRPDAILLDMNFRSAVNNGNEGLYWLSEIRRRFSDIPVILMTAYADIDLAVKGIKQGATDFIVKPWDNEKLISKVESVLNFKRKTASAPTSDEGDMMWGTTAEMKALRSLVEKIAPTDANVLITGENGTGKEVLAREIHRLSSRSSRPMFTVDMGAVAESLFESELFGHRKGAFTGAVGDRKGKLEEASGSTLMMDEIANLPLAMQSKLLVALQSRKVTPLGGNIPVDVDIRLICATNGDIEALVSNGSFREDLLYRINTIHIKLPPLRERRADIDVMAVQFMQEFSERYNRSFTAISQEALELLRNYPWPGNVRELRHSVEKAVIVGEGRMLMPSDFSLSAPRQAVEPTANTDTTLADMERSMIRKAIDECNGNLSAAAGRLGITRQTLYNKMRRYNL
ncbi:MAG: sigma-54-dependent Fis family transcriptional regulator [Bacteroides sp.]|nr:sigma-54-dependent Fis family transcriptional regulator [Bacteroides sp.]